MLEEGSRLFGTSTRTEVLTAICLLDGTYPSELAELLGVRPYTVQSILASLEREAIIVSRLMGRTRVVSLNPRYFAHAELSVEFPPGPLAVGEDLIRSWSTVRRDDEVLYVLSPTDSCRDRLASFLFWSDFSGLEQAIAVYQARANEVDLSVIEDWCRRERHSKKFGTFSSRIGASTR